MAYTTTTTTTTITATTSVATTTKSDRTGSVSDSSSSSLSDDASSDCDRPRGVVLRSSFAEEVELTHVDEDAFGDECPGRLAVSRSTHRRAPNCGGDASTSSITGSTTSSVVRVFLDELLDDEGRLESVRTVREEPPTATANTPTRRQRVVVSMVTRSSSQQCGGGDDPSDIATSASSLSDMLCTVLSFQPQSNRNSNSNSKESCGGGVDPVVVFETPSQNRLLRSDASILSVQSFTSNYLPYYDLSVDFVADNWAQASDYQILGMAAVATATVIVHPIVFFAGAATAVWAVGMYHAAEHGYEFFTDGSFSRIFWDDDEDEKVKPPATTPDRVLIARQAKKLRETKIKYEGLLPETIEEEDEVIVEKEEPPPLPPRRLPPLPPPRSIPPVVVSTSAAGPTELLRAHFAPLEKEVVSRVPFVGLNAEEFFEVFFADNAPYCIQEFQKSRGDVDLNFANWGVVNTKDAFLGNQEKRERDMPQAVFQERVCTFNTLTKSYFGPAYAAATKRQRRTQLRKSLLVLEGRTNLDGIPYGDRFHVDERWVVESSPDKEHGVHTSYLSVYVQVNMIRSCTWESQIRKKTLSTVTEMMEAWCRRAKTALELAERERRKRNDNDCASSLSSLEESTSPTTPTRPASSPDGELMERHKSQLKEIEEHLQRTTNARNNGDSDAGIEVQHSALLGRFATVTDPDGENVVVRTYSIDTTATPEDTVVSSLFAPTLSPICNKEDLCENVTYQPKKNGVTKKIFRVLRKIRK